MAARRRRRKAQRGRRRKTSRPHPPKRSRRPKPRIDWRSPTARRVIVSALRSIAGSLADRLKRAALTSQEAIYLRGIAHLKTGHRLTPAQALAVLSASRGGSPLFHSVFGKREEKLVEAFLARLNARALKNVWKVSEGVALTLAVAAQKGQMLYHTTKRGVQQRWSLDGFRRFITNPIYKLRRDRVFGAGSFWLAHPDRRGDLPKRGKRRLRFT